MKTPEGDLHPITMFGAQAVRDLYDRHIAQQRRDQGRQPMAVEFRFPATGSIKISGKVAKA
jgi:hypothetical protein